MAMGSGMICSLTPRAKFGAGRPFLRVSPHSSVGGRCLARRASPRCEIEGNSQFRGLAASSAAMVLSGALFFTPIPASAQDGWSQCTLDNPVCDTARVIPALEEETLSNDLQQFERENGWRIRILTKFGSEAHPTGEEIKAMWKPDDGTVIVLVDPSAPNILNFSAGESVRSILSRPFFTELKSKYGNTFFVRDFGEQATVTDSVTALQTCLLGGGCDVVPGLDRDHYLFTLVMSIIGGLVFGASTRLDPKGFADRRWVSPVLLSPLWGSLLVSYGIGPVVSRTSDLEPLAGNILAFLAVGFGIFLLPRLGESGSMSEALLDESERNERNQQQ